MPSFSEVRPFRQFVLKVHSRCDLACNHCYVYESADRSWRTKPAVIAMETVVKAADRIAEHAREHRLSAVRVVLHGGEPLLAGAARLAEIVRVLRQRIELASQLDLSIHTNGVRLTTQLCELFLAERVSVGVSIDGDRAGNDLHRRYADGRSSYDQVVRAVELLRGQRYRAIYAGLLCTIDVRNDPVSTYQALAALDPPAIDFLLPHGTWDTPPPGIGPGGTPYADWLTAVFDAWTADHRRVPVRAFESIIATSLGGGSGTEALGLTASDLLVIETDGTLEQADSIKVAYDGAPQTGLDIFRHALDQAASHPGIRARQEGLAGLCRTCQDCPVVISCGGGLYAHRYRHGHGFANPSVFCADLLKLITYVRSRLRPRAVAVSPKSPAERGAAIAAPRVPYELTSAQFESLAAGHGDASAVTLLGDAQSGIARKLLRLLHERVDAATDRGFHAGWSLLAEVETADTAAIGAVLAHPYVRTWMVRTLKSRIRPGRAGSAAEGIGSPPADLGHLAAIAAAAAVRAGVSAEIDVPVTGGYLHLPGLGRLRVGAERSAIIVTGRDNFDVRTAGGKWTVLTSGPTAGDAWQQVRELRSGPFSVRLEDTDPYRDCYQLPTAERLAARQATRWQDQFAQALPLIERDLRDYLPGLAAGLSVITPLANEVPGRLVSASARQAFGAVGAALPPDGSDLALLLLHEVQHVKLGAVLDLFDLVVQDDRLFYAPWRDDPRPAESLLHGAYAHLAIADYWRVRRHQLTGTRAATAHAQFALWRSQTAEVIETLGGADTLTQLGRRFVAGMQATVVPWLSESVPESAAADARHQAAGHRAAWERRLASGGGPDGR